MPSSKTSYSQCWQGNSNWSETFQPAQEEQADALFFCSDVFEIKALREKLWKPTFETQNGRRGGEGSNAYCKLVIRTRVVSSVQCV